MRHRIGVVAVCIVLLVLGTACSSDETAGALPEPCEAFTSEDAQTLLNIDSVHRVSFEELLSEAGTQTTEPQASSQIAAVSKSFCGYRADDAADAPVVMYQYGFASSSFFTSKAKFLSANREEGDVDVSGVGEAALYRPTGSEGGSSLVVLLSGGRNFVLTSAHQSVPAERWTSAAKTIIDRLPDEPAD